MKLNKSDKSDIEKLIFQIKRSLEAISKEQESTITDSSSKNSNNFKEDTKNKNNKPFYCKKCYFLMELTLTHDKNDEELYIHLSCKNNHKESFIISDFLKIYTTFQLNSFPCLECGQDYRNTEDLQFCFNCKEIICLQCKDRHIKNKHSPQEKKFDEKDKNNCNKYYIKNFNSLIKYCSCKNDKNNNI